MNPVAFPKRGGLSPPSTATWKKKIFHAMAVEPTTKYPKNKWDWFLLFDWSTNPTISTRVQIRRLCDISRKTVSLFSVQDEILKFQNFKIKRWLYRRHTRHVSLDTIRSNGCVSRISGGTTTTANETQQSKKKSSVFLFFFAKHAGWKDARSMTLIVWISNIHTCPTGSISSS